MKVVVKLFAAARDVAGHPELEVTVPAGATVGDLREQMRKARPELSSLLSHALLAIDAEYADDRTPLPEDQGSTEIACIPPVSGG